MARSALKLKMRGTGAFFLGMALLALIGCGEGERSAGPVVLELDGVQIRLDDLREEYEVRTGPGSFARSPFEEKQQFLTTIGDKEVLVRMAEEETGGLLPPRDRFLREANENWLVEALKKRRTGPITRDSAAVEAWIPKFNKELRCRWLMHPSDSIVHYCRDQVVAGRPFAELASKYCADDSMRARGGRLYNYIDGGAVGRQYAKELFIEDREPGYLSQVRKTPRGFELFLIEDIRPLDPTTKPGFAEALPLLINSIRTGENLDAWIDSLLSANKFALNEDVLPLVMETFQSYWDSLAVGEVDVKQLAIDHEPPLSLFSAEEQDLPVHDLNGSPVVLDAYVDQLRQVSMKMWPTQRSPEATGIGIRERVLYALQLDQARARKLHATEMYRLQEKITREKLLIEALMTDVIGPNAQVSMEEARTYYDEHLDEYRTSEQIRLSYAVFPTRVEAQSFSREAKNEDGRWWSGQFNLFINKRSDVRCVSNSEVFDLHGPVPEEVEGMIALGLDKNVTDVLDPVRLPDGWAVGRVLFRERDGIRPFDKVDNGLQKILTERRIAEMIEDLVTEGKERFGLKIYPEALGSAESAG